MPQLLLKEEREQNPNQDKCRKNGKLLSGSEHHDHRSQESKEHENPEHSVLEEGRGFQALDLQLPFQVGHRPEDGVDGTEPTAVEAGEKEGEEGRGDENRHPYLYFAADEQEDEQGKGKDLNGSLYCFFHTFSTLYTRGWGALTMKNSSVSLPVLEMFIFVWNGTFTTDA